MSITRLMSRSTAKPSKATTPTTPQRAPHKPIMRIVRSTISPALSRRPAPLDMRCIAWPNLVAVYLSPSASLTSAALGGIHAILQLALQLQIDLPHLCQLRFVWLFPETALHRFHE